MPNTKNPRAESFGEATFALHVRAHKLPPPTREHRFHDVRMWRFDFAWPEMKIAVEIDGTTPGPGGRHQRQLGFENDCEKMNAATLLGWRVLRFTTAQVRTGTALAQTAALMKFEPSAP